MCTASHVNVFEDVIQHIRLEGVLELVAKEYTLTYKFCLCESTAAKSCKILADVDVEPEDYNHAFSCVTETADH